MTRTGNRRVNALYVFRDRGVAGLSKIGINTRWPFRFQQAQAHSPRGIDVAAIWFFPNAETVKSLERKIHLALKSRRHTESHGDEWFTLAAEEAVAQIRALIGLGSPDNDCSPDIPLYRGLPYDDWRERGERYKGEVYKRLLWIHVEDSPERRIKVIHSPLYDLAYQYSFTYNPYRVFLAAAYEHPYIEDGPSERYLAGNAVVQRCWEHIIEDPALGRGILSPQVGWLHAGVSLMQLDQFARQHGLIRFDLAQPKPQRVRPRNGQSPCIGYGTIPPLRRVRPTWPD